MMTSSLSTRYSTPPSPVKDVMRVVVAVLFPPLAVLMRTGFTGHFFLSCLLTFMGYVPGLVHAIWILAKRSSTEFGRDPLY